MFHSTKALLMLSTLLIISCATRAFAENVDISGFEELTPDEFHELVAGKTFTGVHRGHEYAESYTQDKAIDGIQNGIPYNGRWKAGKNNCILILHYENLQTRCWKLLHKDGKYIYGYYNSDGSILTMSHYITFVD